MTRRMAARTSVLVASPDPGLRTFVRLVLGEDRFAVYEVAGGESAALAAAARVPTLLVVDLVLDGPGPFALARGAVPAPVAPRTLLLLPRGERLPADASGIDATLVVPTTAFALLRKVDGLLTDRARPARPGARFDG